ncbi:MAG: AMP-binding protein, partial [Acidimicrobiia bacterium]|nr:AMP-binding protein [Acidimicrobiia bacterium]
MYRHRARHIVDLLHWRAARHGTQAAFAFEGDDGTGTSWTYADLDHHARAVAVALREQARPGDRALLLCPAGAEFAAAFFGSLYAGVVPVPAYPPASARHVARIEVILRDAGTDLIVTTRRTHDRIEKWLGSETTRGAFRFLPVDDVDSAAADAWQMPDSGPDSLAFLQYTSGSTSDPKGVMVSHGNLLANVGMIERNMRFRPGMVMVSWLPMFHDMGLIGNVIAPLFVGGRTILMSPHAFVQAPVRWLRAITRHRGTFTGAPNFGYAFCATHVTGQQKAGLDLSSLEQAYCGSEPIDPRAMQHFTDRFESCGFRPGAFYACYGLAEATLLSTGGIPGEGSPTLAVDAGELARGRGTPGTGDEARELVSCGYSVHGQELRIVDPDTRRELPDGQVGEIWLRGPHVTQGYWRRPELTADVFGGTLDDGTGPFLRTGDLAFRNAGRVFVAGRGKDVIIVRGRNYYPQDIERAALASSAALNAAAAAFSVTEAGGTERVVVVCEVTRQAARALDGDAVAAAIRGAVHADLEIPVSSIVLIKPAALPRTSSGKVRRSTTRDALVAGTLEALHTWSAPEALRAGGEGSAARADEAIRWLRDYAERRIDSRLIDERRTIPPHVVLDFGNHGLLGLQAPREAGGLALSHRDLFRVLAQLAAIDMTLASFVGVHNALGLRPLLRHASDAQRKTWLHAVAQGRELASFAFTEPAAGSHPTAIEATARPDGQGGWLLRGSKKWIGTAAWAGLIHVFAHTLDEDGTRRGITGFAVRQDAPGLVQGPEELTMGMRGMVQNTVYLRDVRVGPEDVLRGVGEGMDVAQDIMEFGRVSIAATAVGLLMRAGQLMARYATRRSIATGRLIDNVVSRERLGQLTVETAALEALVERFAAWLDADVDVPKACFAAVKALAAETSYRGIDRLMQMLGGRGYIETNLVPQMLRDARLLRLFEGPTETMLMFVGSRVATGSGEFLGFLRTLGGNDVADGLAALAAELNGRGEDSQRVAMRLGEAACWGFWLSAVAGAGRDLETTWLRGCFEQSVADARRRTRDPVPSRDDIDAAIAGYAERIGDLDQQRPGVLEQMDPLLRRDGASSGAEERAAAVRPEPVASAPPRLRPDSGTSTQRQIEQWMVRWIAARLKEEPAAIDATRAFADLGLDSLTAVELTRDLEEAFGVSVTPTAAWDFPTIRALAESLATTPKARRTDAPSAPAVPAPGKDATPARVPPPAVAAARTRPDPARTSPAVRPVASVAAAPDASPEAIAVIGMACRFPGGASDVDTFWTLLEGGIDAVGAVPPERWDTEALFDPDPDAPGKLYARHGAFLDDVDRFDAGFFGISPLEASTMDPQQRLLLEVAWEALEQAAVAPDGLRGSRTGVFLGLMYQDYLARQLHDLGRDAIGPYLGTGSTFSAAAGRLSYVLGLQGPSLAVDTACSSSLVSVHLACQSLRAGECDTAIAGGVNVMAAPEAAINLSKARMLSPTGRCRTFDAAADGYTRGEGCGLIVLKRLSRARAEGDRVLGIIRGSAVNQDGRSNGLTAPNGSAQRALMREALAAAGARPEDVGYVECHGTGTPLGDPIEVASVVDVFGDRPADNPLAIGSVKTNFGHLESAAGICGLIKALLVVRHREIPPHLHLNELNPHIDFAGRPVTIPTAPTPWFRRAAPRLAAVNAFGFVGTNAQVIVEGVDEVAASQRDDATHVLTLSASTDAALDALVDRMAGALDTAASLADVCYTTNTGRAHLAHRLAAVADGPQAMAAVRDG